MVGNSQHQLQHQFESWQRKLESIFSEMQAVPTSFECRDFDKAYDLLDDTLDALRRASDEKARA